ncbi:Cathepsin L [Hypsibius exemplaris]|uniref:Cathepsin L n=1 Tax=Hypsibius exemplaris TaxID=2072580 RepID=A0A1W0WSA7_HYPEX|nr:Cathepsin L [Hypsibius exemplaris]
MVVGCLLLLLQVAVAFGALVPDSGRQQTRDGRHNVGVVFNWEKFKEFHGKEYSGQDDVIRKKIYLTNSQKIVLHNRKYAEGLTSYQMEMNHFGDISPKEFRTMMNGFKGKYNETKASKGAVFLTANFVEVPAEVDWRKHGYVTPVKNQGQCGSCWAFSSTGALEGQHFRKSGKLVSLSEQNLVDCSGKYGNEGCNGGLMDQAFDYVKDNGGLDSEDSYPYDGQDKKCRFKKDGVGATDLGHVDVVPAGDEGKLKEAIATVGPVSVAIDASHESFQFYAKGVYDEPACSSEELDHGVLAVGYGTDAGTGNAAGKDYWLVKNSWGEEWGDTGYIKMARNKKNQCGIATSASYPLV